MKNKCKFIQVCGYQRSGTSFLSQLLNIHSDIYISGEVTRNSFSMILKFMESIKKEFDKIGGKEKEAFSQKVDFFVRSTFLSCSKYNEPYLDSINKDIFGNKMPRVERFHNLIDSCLTSSFDVYYIYCLREPLKVLESKMNMRRAARDFEYNLRDYEKSISDLLTLMSLHPDRVVIFSVDEYNLNKFMVISMIFHSIGCASPENDELDLMVNLSPKNTSEDQGKARLKYDSDTLIKYSAGDHERRLVDQSSLCNLAREILKNNKYEKFFLSASS